MTKKEFLYRISFRDSTAFRKLEEKAARNGLEVKLRCVRNFFHELSGLCPFTVFIYDRKVRAHRYMVGFDGDLSVKCGDCSIAGCIRSANEWIDGYVSPSMKD
ncbi:MAG: hypothetical protein J6Y37_15215 [Paludibacteraceae bacterium]|nr:hypothetical protein [Paludibacteraceae bacterium]